MTIRVQKDIKAKNKAIEALENCPTFKVSRRSEEVIREIREEGFK